MNEYDDASAVCRNGPRADPDTGIAASGPPLVAPAVEQLERLSDLALGSSAEYARTRGPRRPLSDDAYRARVRVHEEELECLAVVPEADDRLLVALDVDGTVLDVDGRVSPRMLASIERLRSRGAQVVVSTGRGVEAALPVIRHLGLTDGWAVCANGALTLRMDASLPQGYEVVDSVTFDPGDAIAALTRAVPEAIVAVETLDGDFLVSRPFPDGELIETQTVVDRERMSDRPVTRVILRAPGMDVEEFAALVSASGLHSVEYAIGWTAWLDVTLGGVTKASALEALAARLGTDADHAVAVGDGTNDIEMIRWAGVGVVMGSAPGQVREHGDLVTEPVWHDGCAAVLDAVVERTRKRIEN